jgi:hypothetical protein
MAVGSTVRLQSASGRPIKTVFNERPTVIRVMPLHDDPTTLLITALAVGTARLTLVDVDGQEQVHDFGRPGPGK